MGVNITATAADANQVNLKSRSVHRNMWYVALT